MGSSPNSTRFVRSCYQTRDGRTRFTRFVWQYSTCFRAVPDLADERTHAASSSRHFNHTVGLQRQTLQGSDWAPGIPCKKRYECVCAMGHRPGKCQSLMRVTRFYLPAAHGDPATDPPDQATHTPSPLLISIRRKTPPSLATTASPATAGSSATSRLTRICHHCHQLTRQYSFAPPFRRRTSRATQRLFNPACARSGPACRLGKQAFTGQNCLIKY